MLHLYHVKLDRSIEIYFLWTKSFMSSDMNILAMLLIKNRKHYLMYEICCFRLIQLPLSEVQDLKKISVLIGNMNMKTNKMGRSSTNFTQIIIIPSNTNVDIFCLKSISLFIRKEMKTNHHDWVRWVNIQTIFSHIHFPQDDGHGVMLSSFVWHDLDYGFNLSPLFNSTQSMDTK